MSELPKGWVETTVGELLTVRYGKGLAKASRVESGPIPVFGSSGIVGHHDTPLVEQPAIVVGRKGGAGSVAVTEAPCWPIDTTYYLPVPPGLSPRFLGYQASSLGLRNLDSSTAVPSLRRPDLEAQALRIPPGAEQARIVAAIEEQCSRIDAAEESLHRARRNLQRFRGAALASAFENGSPMTRIGEIARVGSGATPKRDRAEYWHGSIPWVTSGQLSGDFVDEPAEFITERALAETSVKRWPAGTLLVAMYGEGQTRGRCSELRFESTSNQACAAIVVDEVAVDRTYLKRFFAASYESNRRLASGGVQPNLSLGIIRDLEVPLPSLDEQRRIVAEVERQLSLVDAQAVAIDVALKRSATLLRAILEQAFSGTLVSQDPEDEPASALLERIRAERKPAEKRARS